MDERCSIALSVRRGHWPPKYPRDGVGLFGRDGIGGPLLIVLGVLGVVFPVIAAIKANNGVVWQYPLTIRVLK